MKLEVGMYVRTKKGKIARIIDNYDNSGSLHKNNIVWKTDTDGCLALHSSKIIRASHSIIDLIRVGDYVNGILIDYIEELGHESIKCVWHNFDEEYDYEYFRNEDIKSIVTKEQFEQMSYKVGE